MHFFFFVVVASKPLKCITKARVGLEAGASVRGANSEHQAINKDIVSNSMSRWIWKVVSWATLRLSESESKC